MKPHSPALPALPLQALDPLPPAPANVRFEYHPNSCYDWGTFGWLLDTGKIQPAGYKYFIFMNSSVRGPFIPPYLQVRSWLC